MSAPIFDQDGRPVEGAGVSAPASAAASAAPVGGGGEPEFLPMSLEQARALLAREHSVGIGKDDPILMLVTLHQGFCSDLNQLLAGFRRNIQAMMVETGNCYAEAVDQTLESLKDKTVKASLEQSMSLVANLAAVNETMKRRMWRFGLYHTFLALVTGLAALLSLAVLFNIIR